MIAVVITFIKENKNSLEGNATTYRQAGGKKNPLGANKLCKLYHRIFTVLFKHQWLSQLSILKLWYSWT
jgi:hypothetical protein